MIGGASRLVVLGGGFGCAKFVEGLLHGVRSGELPGVDPTAELSVIVNTADDLWVHGLRVCPDLDTVMYTLGHGMDRERGWGRRDEAWLIGEELRAYGVDGTWFGLGDRDIATHLVRSRLLAEGRTLTEVTETLCERWRPGVTLLPMTDAEVETHVAVGLGGDAEVLMHFQEYWIRNRAQPAVRALHFLGVEAASPGPDVLATILEADLVFLAPSNPIVSIGPVVAVAGVREALRATPAPVVGLSPIVGGSHVRGMANQLLTWAGVEVSAGGVGLHYGARSAGGLLDAWLIDGGDRAELAGLWAAGLRADAVPLLMTDVAATTAMVRAQLALVDLPRRSQDVTRMT